MQWRRWLTIAPGSIALVAILAWYVLVPSGLRAIEAEHVRRVEVRFEPWGEDGSRTPGAISDDREAIAALVAVIRSGQETPDHKCGSRGAITFEGSAGFPAQVSFLPGHHPEWYEFRAAGKVYRVPRADFVGAMQRIGVAVPLECQ